ncbi:MgtC/SapB family protein [Melaminivora jejuensis]|uniref:MgtC/SapB family protein n=1 Tax=Melaminivora jejuensis TaxID=1267217 RepID=UPI001E58EFC8|nr:MgtC/SapB family protein [Melaminivora jejuensis]UHJ65407.1 MgtC/SapB family protein [Melaminivora jejuensis]
MPALHNIDPAATLNTLVSLFFAFVFGSVIGLERQIRQRTAGLRTNALVAVGAAVFVDLSMRMNGVEGAARVVSNVITGVGFLGAGAIMKEGINVTGLNTAATLWGSAAVGACAGAGFIVEAALATLFVLASNTLLRPVVNHINRSPLSSASSEATYHVYALCRRADQSDVRERMVQLLDDAHYPVRTVHKNHLGLRDTEIEAVLYATSVEGQELEAAVQRIEELPGVLQAYWNAGGAHTG